MGNKKEVKMSNKKIKNIWNAFKEKEGLAYKEFIGTDTADIEKVGYKKFIKMIGWTDESQVDSYKTDRFHITICSECNKEFCVYEENFGLCEKCASQYNIKQFKEDHEDLINAEKFEEASSNYLLFLAYKSYRDFYKPEALREAIIENIIKGNLNSKKVKKYLASQIKENHNKPLEQFIKSCFYNIAGNVDRVYDLTEYAKFKESITNIAENEINWEENIIKKIVNIK